MEFGHVAGDVKAVGKAGRHPEHLFVALVQVGAHPLAEGGGALAHVHGDVEHFAFGDAHQFALGLLMLEVQATQDALAGAGVVVLHELVVAAVLDEFALAEGFHEEAAFVAKDFWGYEFYVWDG